MQASSGSPIRVRRAISGTRRSSPTPVASSPSLKESPRKPCLTAGAYVHILNAMAIERHFERELEILTAIEEGVPLTQRALAQRLGVALGLTNLYLKRLAKKGYIKIAEFRKKPAARKRLRYVLTPTGIREKTRLTYEHVAYALNLYWCNQLT